MNNDASDLFSLALKLPPVARAALADSLIDSLEDEIDEDAEEMWRSEIARRTRELAPGAVQAIAWEDVRRKLRSQSRG